MTDDQILDVIAKSSGHRIGSPKFVAEGILAFLRDAGYDIVPYRIAMLGWTVESMKPTGLAFCDSAIDRIYAEAGVERP